MGVYEWGEIEGCEFADGSLRAINCVHFILSLLSLHLYVVCISFHCSDLRSLVSVSRDESW